MTQLTKTRSEAFELLKEYTKSESLVKHMLSVEAAMRWYAKHFGEDEELWGMTGLLHDFDYERYPEPTPDADPPGGHPFEGCRKLRELGYPEIMIDAIMGHATYTGVARETQLAKTLFAVDELCGLVTASVLVRPDRSIMTLTPKSVKKKMKDKAFARGVNRDDIRVGCEELEIEVGEHIGNVIQAMQDVAEPLGLEGNPA